MKRRIMKTIALTLSFVMLFTAGAVNLSASACDCGICPSIVIPGVFQSDVRYYDADGNLVNTEYYNVKGEKVNQ